MTNILHGRSNFKHQLYLSLLKMEITDFKINKQHYSGTSCLGHLPLGETQNLVPEKCSHFCIYYLFEGTPLFREEEHFFWVPKPGFNLPSGDTIAIKK